MEKSFDFGRLLKNHEKKHKRKPAQFISVASGVQKRLETTLKSRKSTRLTIFDSIRNLSRCSSPAPLSEAQQKVEHRRQQLEKWKEEKAKKKKEAAAQKKKPFIAGVPRAPLKFVPPPAAVKPSTSGRVTRSQTARNSKPVKEKPTQSLSQSFAPKNASFKPPQLKNIPKGPFVSLVPLKPSKSKIAFTFDPVLPKEQEKLAPVKEVKQTRANAQKKLIETKELKQSRANSQRKPVETKVPQKAEMKNNAKTTKTIFKANSKTYQSSSSECDSIKSPLLRDRRLLPVAGPPAFQSTSSETDSSSQSPELSKKKEKTSIKTHIRQSLPASDSPILVSRTPRRSTPSASKKTTPKNKVPKSESSSEEKLRPAKSPPVMQMTPEQIMEEAKRISPCVTMSRGKANARREMKQKLDDGLLDEDTSDIDNVDHFRRQLASEIKRMTEMCETWDRISEQNVLSDSIQECILSAVGQSRLLMSQKLQQFASLVERCARPEPGAALVTPADLAGFWDMVFMQIENVDVRFKKLEELRSRGWEAPPEAEASAPAVAARRARAPPARARGAAAQPSRIKEMIAAARRAKKEQTPATLAPDAAAPPAEKSFEAGFFCVRSPVRSPVAPATPRCKPSLLKAVLSSEAKKSASKQTPLHSTTSATPGRSILKQASTKKSSKKSIKVVLFDQSDTDINTSLEEPAGRGDDQPMEAAGDRDVSMDVEKEEKENMRRRSHRLTRQDAVEDRSPVMTRSRRKSTASPQEDSKAQERLRNPPSTKTPQSAKTPEKGRRAARKSKVLEDVENVMHQNPQRSTRRRGAATQEVYA